MAKHLKATCKTFICKVKHKTAHTLHHMEQPFHCVYLGAVFWEAHGAYGMAAGGLLLVTIFNAFIHE